MLTKEQAELILDKLNDSTVFRGSYNKAKEYLDNDDLVGFEEVCRGNYHWIRDNIPSYKLTDGVATTWHDNGQIRTKTAYLNKRVDGDHIVWYENGNKRAQLHFKNDKCHGDHIGWYENGKTHFKYPHVDGQRHGTCYAWDVNGRAYVEATYINGVKQEN